MAPKSALKSIKAYLDKGDFQKAADEAQELTKQDRHNHTALLFLGFAQEKLGNLNETENALRLAVEAKPQDPQAYKGLVTLYEKQGPSKLDQYHVLVQGLAQIYADQEDREQCQNAIDKYELFVKKYGTQPQYRRALELLLPTSPLYSTLEGRVMSPSLVYQRILESAENEEKEWINSQIGERRTRIGSNLEQATRDVKLEAVTKFDLEEKYTDLIDWTQDDELRHELEQRRFQRAFDNLMVLPSNQKPAQRDKVLSLANGMVIIKQQFPLAWQVALEWVDAENVMEWDPNIFRQYIDYFPDDGLSKVLRGFLDSGASPFPHEETPPNAEDDDAIDIKLSEADQLILMNEGLEDCQQSPLAHRIMARTYLHLEEHESTAATARKAQSLYSDAEKSYALDLTDSLDGVNMLLANALIHYQSPRHHAEAKAIFQSILARKPKLTAALLGVGLIFEEDEDYPEAVKFLQQAADRDAQNIRIKLELAWCRAMNHDLQTGLEQLEDILESVNEEKPINLSMRAEVLYRIGYCKWHIDSSPSARKDKSGAYKYLIESVKANPNYAPAYTLLGTYFHDYGKSKPRARVAFQKAFEISTSELLAAERLANMFAKNKEWDLVELVAKRVVNSGKAKPSPGSKKKALSWPYAAMGVVEMNKQQYSQSIVSFQAALRITPNHYHSWVGLGESYHNSGRFIAASRAFSKAESIDHGLSDDQTWFAKYMLANVQKEIGSFDAAIEAYESVLRIKHDEYGVLIAMLQSIAENAWAKIALGMFGGAGVLASKAIVVAHQIAQQHTDTFNLWKAVGDACSALGHSKAFASEVDLATLSSLLQTQHGNDLDVLSDLDKVNVDLLDPAESEDLERKADQCLVAAILAYKRGVYSSSSDIHAQAVSWYNLGWAEHRAYISSGPSLQTKGKKPQRFIRAAMKCFKRAIELEASNADFWNALGVVTMTTSPRVAQHSFVRSLHLNEHSARTWTNLGSLYIVNSDNDLAYVAFTRAQSADPEYAEAWVGQGLLSMLENKMETARGYFLHAFEISDSTLLSVKRRYATSVFDHLVHAGSSAAATDFLQPLFAVRQLHELSPSNVSVSHLMALYAERASDFESASKVLEEVCEAVEAEYEKSESNEYLARFAQAKSDLARVQLAQRQYEAAVENAETAIDLSSEDDDLDVFYADIRAKWRLSAHVTAGLAHSHLKAIDKSIMMFQNALEESPGNPDVICMLAQVLWAKGGQAEKEAATSQLLDCISNSEGHVEAICLLAVIGLCDGDGDIIEAVEDDLKGLLTRESTSDADKMKVGKVLAAVLSSRRGSVDDNLAVIGDATSNIMHNPGQVQGWMELAQAGGDQYAADMAKKNALRQMPPNGSLEAGLVAEVYRITGQKKDALQAKMLAPWEGDGLATLEASL